MSMSAARRPSAPPDRQHVDDAMAFPIADDGTVTIAALPRPVVDVYHAAHRGPDGGV
jgi:hypothetical protein